MDIFSLLNGTIFNPCVFLDYNYISRSIRGLVALGEYSFREFIPFLYKLKIDEVPESIWNDFTVCIF